MFTKQVSAQQILTVTTIRAIIVVARCTDYSSFFAGKNRVT